MGNENIQKILEIGQRWYTPVKLTESEKDLIKSEYRKEAREVLGDCSYCYAKAYDFFLNINKKPKNMDSQFKMKDGKQIHSYALHAVITSKNLTDQLALALLKKTPAAIKHFTSFPADWREQADAYVPTNVVQEDKEEMFEQRVTQEMLNEHPELIPAGAEIGDTISIPKSEINNMTKAIMSKVKISKKEVEGVEVEKKVTKPDDNSDAMFDEKKKSFEAKNKKQLQEIATNLELPEGEWDKLSHKKLVDYLMEKTAA